MSANFLVDIWERMCHSLFYRAMKLDSHKGGYAMQYRNIELIDIPSGMGGLLPAAVAADHGDDLQVICLHPEYFNNWLLSVKRSECRPMSYKLTDGMRRIIDSRKAA